MVAHSSCLVKLMWSDPSFAANVVVAMEIISPWVADRIMIIFIHAWTSTTGWIKIAHQSTHQIIQLCVSTMQISEVPRSSLLASAQYPHAQQPTACFSKSSLPAKSVHLLSLVTVINTQPGQKKQYSTKDGARRRPICNYAEGCTSNSSFNVKGSENALFCSFHKEPAMVDVIHQRCEVKGCAKQPSCTYEGASGRRFCAAHKLPGMVDVISKQCEHGDCKTWPSFNVPGSARAKYCASHKLLGMVNVVAKICQLHGCSTQASFGAPNGPKLFCSLHKSLGMVNKNTRLPPKSLWL